MAAEAETRIRDTVSVITRIILSIFINLGNDLGAMNLVR